jgi:Right handed beta helix region
MRQTSTGDRSMLLGLAVALALLAPSTASAQNAVTVVSASGYGNYHAGGILLTVSGDANGNATAALEWRLAGGSFLPAQPLERIDAIHFAGSLLDLTPGTSYEARVTVADPDGVAGSPVTASLATRSEALAEPTLRTLYVSPGGGDGNPGTSPGAPLRTIQHAADLAQAGDLVLIQPGVYRESVTVFGSGMAAQPIVFRGNGAGAILDGADAAIAAGVTWTPAAGGIWSRVTGFATGHVVTEAGRLYRYGSLGDLQGLAAGAPGGFYFDGTTLYLKFADASPPASHTIHVARLEDGFYMDGLAYVRIENLEIRHYGAGDYGKGVYLRFSSDCAVRSCRIHEVGSAGVWVKGGERHLVEGNQIWDTSIFGWPWGETKGSSAENNAIVFTDDVGRGHVIRRNTVHGTFNGIAPCGSDAPPSGVTNETDVYENVLYQHTDDGFEPEGYCSNLRLWGNRLQDVHMAFAVAPAAPGPLYLVRNVAWRVGNTRTSLQDGYTASAIKINSGYTEPVGPLLVYHNTFLTDVPGTDAIALLNPGESTFVRARNNVIAGTRYAIYKVNPVAWSGDGDDLYTTDASRLVSWMGMRYDTLGAFRALGQEPNGLSAPPQLTSPASGNFTPQTGSPLIDAGVALAGINDSYTGAGPDVGAVEWSGPPPALGFYTVAPCRRVDTRDPLLGGPYPVAAGADGVFTLAGACGIPVTAKAVSLNLTVTQPTAQGNLRIYPEGAPLPLASTLNYVAGQTRANNAIALLSASGKVAVRCSQVSGSAHVVLDVNGYFE